MRCGPDRVRKPPRPGRVKNASTRNPPCQSRAFLPRQRSAYSPPHHMAPILIARLLHHAPHHAESSAGGALAGANSGAWNGSFIARSTFSIDCGS